MKPSQISSAIRQIASNIDNSKNPNQALVARDLRKIIASMADDTLRDLKTVIDKIEQAADAHDGGGSSPGMTELQSIAPALMSLAQYLESCFAGEDGTSSLRDAVSSLQKVG